MLRKGFESEASEGRTSLHGIIGKTSYKPALTETSLLPVSGWSPRVYTNSLQISSWRVLRKGTPVLMVFMMPYDLGKLSSKPAKAFEGLGTLNTEMIGPGGCRGHSTTPSSSGRKRGPEMRWDLSKAVSSVTNQCFDIKEGKIEGLVQWDPQTSRVLWRFY